MSLWRFWTLLVCWIESVQEPLLASLDSELPKCGSVFLGSLELNITRSETDLLTIIRGAREFGEHRPRRVDDTATRFLRRHVGANCFRQERVSNRESRWEAKEEHERSCRQYRLQYSSRLL